MVDCRGAVSCRCSFESTSPAADGFRRKNAAQYWPLRKPCEAHSAAPTVALPCYPRLLFEPTDSLAPSIRCLRKDFGKASDSDHESRYKFSVVSAATDDAFTRAGDEKIWFGIVIRRRHFDSFEQVRRGSDEPKIRIFGGSGWHCSRSPCAAAARPRRAGAGRRTLRVKPSTRTT
jgi:hypothetical protein